ncbi:PaaI family thioesterase [Croceicoccus pelagius]|uniref:Phenylacetic acid degradation protein n=1 Tax=Croceicoccus pelagius TaxID=1703341 RepID=A0A916YI10_9SPHN|nr:PaaI family thioesterase [Croceicoccus pelagius]GGD45566.1 phenylacetic acid degradation protein [Croceicoccus pelagius]
MQTDTDPISELFDKVLSPGGRTLGAKLIAYDADERKVTLSFEALPEFTNILGNLHGGYVTAMLDEAAGMAAKLSLPLTKAVPSLCFTVNFLSPTPVGTVFGEASIIKLGRTTAVLEASLQSPDGKTCAMMTVTAAVIDIG